MAGPALIAQNSLPTPPEATPKSREEKRFSRADKDKNGRIEREELLASRRKAFAKLDKNGNGALSFDEWAVKTIDKFAGADKDRSAWLDPAEYATTAPLRRRKNAVRVNSVFNPTLPA
jgi:Ca2+-binding EF-hand superfamily protein